LGFLPFEVALDDAMKGGAGLSLNHLPMVGVVTSSPLPRD
jgi:hypothetical protein